MENRIEELMKVYGLTAHPEGGSFVEAWESTERRGERPLAGSIYFLLRGAEISHLHVIDCDEVWYYHEGCGMEIVMVDREGGVERAHLGPDTGKGQRMMIAIPAGVVFGARNLNPEGYTFVSCATAPRFTYNGFRLVNRQEMEKRCPKEAASLADMILD
ncbi:MAG: cupin domain-containing protein [Clostridia bacterium]|nr:cupin domain-containing protein [Clostridia bacterium]